MRLVALVTGPAPVVCQRVRSQPILHGAAVALIGFTGAFAIVLAGLRSVGATDAQAASGLLALTVLQGVLAIGLSLRYRMPLLTAWSTPGAALLVAAGTQSGGYPAVVGAFILAGALSVLAGLWPLVTKAIAAIPGPLASGLLAGVLLQVCIAPAQAAVDVPAIALPMIVVWLVATLYSPRWAVPAALAVVVIGVAIDPVSGGAHPGSAPQLDWVTPAFDIGTLIGLGIPLFVVTMVSQNVTGFAVLAARGYQAPLRPVLVSTGAATAVAAPFGTHGLNLAAITADMVAGPEADPDPARRWIASVSAGATYVALGLAAGLATTLLGASPPVLIEAVAGLALLATLTGALKTATENDEQRDAAIITFLVTASGISVAGVSAPFWGLVAGLLFLWLRRRFPAS